MSRSNAPPPALDPTYLLAATLEQVVATQEVHTKFFERLVEALTEPDEDGKALVRALVSVSKALKEQSLSLARIEVQLGSAP